MELIINIHKKDYQSILNSGQVPYSVVCAIMNGTPLPKEHGRLIDKDKMMADLLTVDPQYQDLINWCLQATNAQPTIIEADGDGEDGEDSACD